jgi:Peptidase family M28
VQSSGGPSRGWPELVRALASFARPSASAGERRGAELIAAELRERGCEVSVEEERAHGTYWWPVAAANALALAGAFAARRGGLRGRAGGALAAGVAAAGIWDDLGQGTRWFRRALMPYGRTWNVLAWTGDSAAQETVVFIAHHDAAHSGLVFHPALGEIGPTLVPDLHRRSTHIVPILYGVWLGPAAVLAGALLGSRRLRAAGAVLCAGAIAAMLDIATRPAVAGANDNLAAVGALAALAERVGAVEGVRVLLLSTGSEESFSEGMQGFMDRHSEELDPDRTDFVCLECLGGSTLIVLDGEGMLRMRDYTPALCDALDAAAARRGIELGQRLRTVGATDALVPLRAGWRAVTLASVEPTKLPLNYHWPTDIPENLHWQTVERAIDVCEEFVRDLARVPARAS